MGCIQSNRNIESETHKSNVNSTIFNKEDAQAKKQRAAKRQAAIRELINTETTYINGMKLCIENYYNTLLSNNKIISFDDLRAMFNDLETIYHLNCTFLLELEKKYIKFDNSKTRIGDQFVKFCPYFKMYQSYCNLYESAMVLLNKYSGKQSFVNICMEIRDSKCNGQTLQSLLILPIQRLPRYKLCLTEIVKNTENNHPDLVDLKRALKLVEQTTTLINERMKEYESRQLVREIESKFDSKVSLIKPHRKFISQGIMKKVDKTGKDCVYTFFLFNDMICYASGNNDKLKMHAELSIDRAFFIQDIPFHNKYSDRAFEIHSSIKSFIVHCDEYEQKNKWLINIRKVISDVIRLQGKTQQRELAAPLMVPDDWSENCMICEKPFTFVNRRHHCRKCGKLICGKCGKYKLVSTTDKNEFVKPVCSICYNSYHGNFDVIEKQKSIINERNNVNKNPTRTK